MMASTSASVIRPEQDSSTAVRGEWTADQLMPCVNFRKRNNRRELIDEREMKEEFRHFVDKLSE